ncbi:MAG: pro-sigmaK processing inhibitor BofA family protein [Oscillospiraceae bacterium]|jgi:hypothetical protein|nr:pro-sigmaK processing inhibitor BofA family protein [Oscillospiraceae bacterium]
MTFSLWRFVLILGAALALICMLGLLARGPKRRSSWIAVNAGSGLAAMLTLNLLLPSFGLIVPVNLVSIAVAGTLGVPGVALAAALYAIL